MKISIIHPTRNRPQQAFNTMQRWVGNADNDIEYVLSIDSDDTSDYSMFNCYVLIGDNKSAIEAINKAASNHITGDVLVVVSDDFNNPPPHWDSKLLRDIDGKKDFIVKTQDGLQPILITLPIMDKTYWQRFGYVYHPDYIHLFSDQEMTAVGHMLGKVITSSLVIPHNHYSTGKTPKDGINIKNDRTWHQGETLFNERLKTNFGIENPVIPYSEIKWR